MKRLLSLVAACLLLSGCHHYRPFDIYFWTSAPGVKAYHLYLDNHYAGEVPGLAQPPQRLDEETLHRHLPSGNYQVTLKDDQGKTVYQERLRILWSTRDKTIATEVRNSSGTSSKVEIKGSVIVEEFQAKGAQADTTHGGPA